MKLKPSFYNLVVDETDDEVYLWNAKRGSVVKLERTLFEEIGRQPLGDAVALHREDLVKAGFLVPADLDELQEILFYAKQRQYSLGHDSFGLVIAPTMDCNFHCPYCFENGIERKGHMSAEVQHALSDAIAQKLKEDRGIKRVRITWFGGEPLLAYDDAIVPLQKALIDLCEAAGVQIAFSLITNGFYLTEEKYDVLFRNGHTKFVQITLDGSGTEYAKRKGTSTEAFDRVIGNLLDLSECAHLEGWELKINVRFNADNENYSNIKELVSFMKSDRRFHENIYFALERLRKYGDCHSLGQYCTTEEFEDLKYDFDEFVGQPFKFCEPKTVFCGQHCMNVFCVGVHGEIYKCEHDFGIPDHSIGTIGDGLTYRKYFLEFMDQPLPKKCMECKILPVCMGGCPHRRLANGGRAECDYTVRNQIRAVKRYILKKEVK